ncbi:hypothetical protein B0H15DRAFT_806534 [Mycena belliarum]|uniref:Uncharacterized protein n=1 Tax=Mycena belliarum TaxID=1033014 RepID=A0AAD6TTK8_9AGAR|nr:hypothetical protein B0H15DRAFT_806534 [Mycena belliae]
MIRLAPKYLFYDLLRGGKEMEVGVQTGCHKCVIPRRRSFACRAAGQTRAERSVRRAKHGSAPRIPARGKREGAGPLLLRRRITIAPVRACSPPSAFDKCGRRYSDLRAAPADDLARISGAPALVGSLRCTRRRALSGHLRDLGRAAPLQSCAGVGRSALHAQVRRALNGRLRDLVWSGRQRRARSRARVGPDLGLRRGGSPAPRCWREGMAGACAAEPDHKPPYTCCTRRAGNDSLSGHARRSGQGRVQQRGRPPPRRCPTSGSGHSGGRADDVGAGTRLLLSQLYASCAQLEGGERGVLRPSGMPLRRVHTEVESGTASGGGAASVVEDGAVAAAPEPRVHVEPRIQESLPKMQTALSLLSLRLRLHLGHV